MEGVKREKLRKELHAPTRLQLVLRGREPNVNVTVTVRGGKIFGWREGLCYRLRTDSSGLQYTSYLLSHHSIQAWIEAKVDDQVLSMMSWRWKRSAA